MANFREPNTQPIAAFDIPYSGTWQTLPQHKLPSDVLYNASNIVVRNGSIQARPGLSPYIDSVITGVPKGMFQYVNNFGTKIPLLFTSSHGYKYLNQSWVNITGSNFSSNNQIRATVLETTGNIVAVITDGVTALKQFDGGAITDITPDRDWEI